MGKEEMKKRAEFIQDLANSMMKWAVEGNIDHYKAYERMINVATMPEQPVANQR